MHMMECAYGMFERVVSLPVEVDGSRASASYRSGVLCGVLYVALPKRRVSKARRISVSQA